MTKLTILTEGQYSVDSTKEFIPFNPAIHQAADRPASLFVHVQPFLLETKNELLLIDTGLGYKNEEGELFIHKQMLKHGYKSTEVTKVLMSHLHFDHSGGMMFQRGENWELSFPNAEYIIQKKELESAIINTSKSYHTKPIEALRRSSNLVEVDGDGMLEGFIKYELTGGHCPFHQVFTIKSDSEIYFFGGDVMPEAMQVQRKVIAKYDFDGRKSMELRTYYGNLAAAENWHCLMYHDKKHAITQFELENGAFVIRK